VTKGLPENANFAQLYYDEDFSPNGPYNGKTITNLLNEVNGGVRDPNDIIVRYIVREGHVLIQNTRTTQLLERLGIPRSEWMVKNMTGDVDAENSVSNQLWRNRLTEEGTPTVVTKEEFLKANPGYKLRRRKRR
jgi:hypothetical protein